VNDRKRESENTVDYETETMSGLCYQVNDLDLSVLLVE